MKEKHFVAVLVTLIIVFSLLAHIHWVVMVPFWFVMTALFGLCAVAVWLCLYAFTRN